MAIRQYKPKPLVITNMDSLDRIRASAYVCTAGFNSVQAADELDLAGVRKSKQHPLRDFQLSRLGWWGDRIVGHVGVIRIPVRLGKATLTAAGIAGVCADPRARNHGVASALLKEVLAASRRAGLSFSMLFGIPDFYHRFGFVPALPKQTQTIKVQDLPAVPRWRSRKAKPADYAKMIEHYDGLYGAFDGTAVRDPGIFSHRKRDTKVILQGPARSDWAYLVYRVTKIHDIEQLEVIEAAGSGLDWPLAVMSLAARQAAKLDKSQVEFRLPATHPICREMIFRNATLSTTYYRNESAMVAVLDFPGLAGDMAPEWSARLRSAKLATPATGLLVRFGEQTYRWWPAEGRTECLAQSPVRLDAEFNSALARLTMGYGRPEAIMRHYGMRASERALPILKAIFAERNLAFSPVDFF